MKLIMCSIHDSKASIYHKPMFFMNEAVARRAFQNIVNAPETEIAKNPEDFTLMHVGEFDDANGSINNFEANISLGCALDYQREELPPVRINPDDDSMTETKGTE